MERHKNLAPLSREHHRFLVLSQLLKINAPDYRGLPTTLPGKIGYTLDFYENVMVPHFWREENKLFPVLAKHHPDLKLLTETLVEEHRELASLIRSLPTARNSEDALDQLGGKLAHHVRKEERELFQLAQKLLPDAVLNSLRLGKVKG